MTALVAATAPTLEAERRHLDAGVDCVAGIDEVGRGSLAGPVTVGIVVVDARTGPVPDGLRDSKLLAPAARRRLAPLIEDWAPAHAIGHAGAREIDRYGIMRALRLAAERALEQLDVVPGAVVLDGGYDWLRRPAPVGRRRRVPAKVPIELMVKADLACASVAAASVLAGRCLTRNALMASLSDRYPAYGWAANKGYAAAEHRAAIAAVGPSAGAPADLAARGARRRGRGGRCCGPTAVAEVSGAS